MNHTSDQLIFDLGFHRGEDTDHYLALGHRVVVDQPFSGWVNSHAAL